MSNWKIYLQVHIHTRERAFIKVLIYLVIYTGSLYLYDIGNLINCHVDLITLCHTPNSAIFLLMKV